MPPTWTPTAHASTLLISRSWLLNSFGTCASGSSLHNGRDTSRRPLGVHGERTSEVGGGRGIGGWRGASPDDNSTGSRLHNAAETIWCGNAGEHVDDNTHCNPGCEANLPRLAGPPDRFIAVACTRRNQIGTPAGRKSLYCWLVVAGKVQTNRNMQPFCRCFETW